MANIIKGENNMSKKTLEDKVQDILYQIGLDYDSTKDCLIDDYEYLREELNLNHITEYDSNTDDYNIGFEIGYLRALEEVSSHFHPMGLG
jgi:hypothetical protein